MRRFLKIAGWILILSVVLFGLFLLIFTLIDYRPEPVVEIYSGSDSPQYKPDSTITVMIWNIGYAGLGEEMDFFYDGGKRVRTSKIKAKEHLNAIANQLKKLDSIDFILLQEVDLNSKRSYRMNQFLHFDSLLANHYGYFATNYQVAWVPVPLGNSLGKVKSGLATYSIASPVSVYRHGFPGNYAWPTSLFMLDRCFQVMRYNLPDGKQLVLVNTHNSAYDDGSLRDMQMNYFKDFLVQEYKNGNKIIVGGDWNQSPPDFKPGFVPFDTINCKFIANTFPDTNWNWAYDADVATNRRLQKPYSKGSTFTTVIDFFLCSPNISIEKIETINLNFVDSDHQPVLLTVKL